MADPLDALRVPAAPVAPDPAFAAALRQRLVAALVPEPPDPEAITAISLRGDTAMTVTEPTTTNALTPYIAVHDAAAALDWNVYCALLPSGWFVDSGEYRQAGGGRLEIAYRGPGGAHLELHEGAFCADTAGCIPPGTESGDATFGDLAATLIATDDGGWAATTEPNGGMSWLAIGSGVNEAAFRSITDALAIVDG